MTAASRRKAAAVGLLALATFAGAACDKQATCRPGTVFLHVGLGPFTTANVADVGISVDGATAMTTSLPLDPGARSGGVEIVFPNGYPAGKEVVILVTLKANGTPIAARGTTIRVLGGGCDVVDLTFTGADAITGAGGAGGSNAGAGGNSGTGGAAGTLGGVAGTSGGVGGTGGLAGAGGTGATGGSAGGTSGAPGRGGSGGATGGSAAGTSGGPGRGGMGGTTGVAGRGGSGGSAGAGGTGPACVPAGAENCFNGKDDDCDGRFDCADTDCGPVAQCVPVDPTGGGRVGVMVAANAACPTGYTDQFTIMSGLGAGPCAGCSCRSPTTTCSTTISSFGTVADCNSPSNPGTPEITFNSTQACTTPSWTGSMFGNIYGVQTTMFTPSSGSCTAQGAATPGPVTWASTMRFCASATVSVGTMGGCATAQACVPVISAAKCAMFDGAHACQTGTTSTSWNTGATDTRMCGACTCGGATGASCSSMVLIVGTDYTCTTVTQMVSSGQRKCYTGTGVYSPGLIFSGTPTPPTCPANATLSGSVTPTGPKTLCCM